MYLFITGKNKDTVKEIRSHEIWNIKKSFYENLRILIDDVILCLWKRIEDSELFEYK